MADRAISELIAAEQINATDLFVLEQNNTAKKLTGQVLLNWLTAAADGHGGIQSIQKTNTQGLVDTYTITLADTTTFSFNVTNGKSIQSISLTGTSGLVDTYTISFNDGSSQTFTVTNGEKGDKGDNAYVWIKWASQQPTAASHSFGDVPDNWMGIYSGNAVEAPSDWQEYDWFEVKGEKGDTGAAAAMLSQEVVYQVSDSGTIYPSGAWSQTIPVTPAGKYLWTRTTLTFNSGDPVVSYSVSRMGIDGQGAVSSVAGISPDSEGNVPLNAENVGAMPITGGAFTGPVNMNGQPLSGLNPPTEDSQAATKGYVDANGGVVVSDTEPEKKVPLWINLSGAPQNVFLDLFYPVGSVYISAVNASPAARLGGTWERIKDRFLLAAGDEYAAGSVGGNAEITQTVEQMPSHTHNSGFSSNFKVIGGTTAGATVGSGDSKLYVTAINNRATSATGSAQPMNIMNPYKAYYMWERIA